MKVINLICLVVCIALAAAETLSKPRVVGGDEAIDGQFPYQVSLRSRIFRQHFCGASILSNRFLVTAAHCTSGLKSRPFFVVAVVGSVSRGQGGNTYKLNKIYRHEGWNMNLLVNDISLLRTAQDITFTDTIQPIALPKQNIPEEQTATVVLTGWGRYKFPSQQLPNILQYAEAQTLNPTDCVARFKNSPYARYVHDTSLCTTNKPGVGACHGDSGGPLVDVTNPENKALVGIVSWGIPCAQGYPDVYTRVYSYVDWIQKHMEDK